MEFRRIMGNIHANGNRAGTFNFARGATGILGANSGSPFASFLLGAVDNGNADLPRGRHHAIRARAPGCSTRGDTWRVGSKLTLDYGLRWDYFSPSSEKYNRVLVLRSGRRQPRRRWTAGPIGVRRRRVRRRQLRRALPRGEVLRRLPAASSAPSIASTRRPCCAAAGASSTRRRSTRGGVAASAQEGFSTNAALLEHARRHSAGVPAAGRAARRASCLRRSSARTIATARASSIGRSTPTSARTRTSGTSRVDREIGRQLSLSVAYVGSAGRRLPSSNRPLNALNPSLLSMGQALNDEFQPGQTSLNGVAAALRRLGRAAVGAGCAPSVAQALRPYPQVLRQPPGSQRESWRVALQLAAAQAREALLGRAPTRSSRTRSRRPSPARSDGVQRDAVTWSGAGGVISPFEEDRNESIARRRHAARAVGGVRLRAALRPGSQVHVAAPARSSTRWSAVGRRARSSATRRGCRCSSGSTARPATCPAHSASVASRPSPTPTRCSPRTRAASTRTPGR